MQQTQSPSSISFSLIYRLHSHDRCPSFAFLSRCRRSGKKLVLYKEVLQHAGRMSLPILTFSSRPSRLPPSTHHDYPRMNGRPFAPSAPALGTPAHTPLSSPSLQSDMLPRSWTISSRPGSLAALESCCTSASVERRRQSMRWNCWKTCLAWEPEEAASMS